MDESLEKLIAVARRNAQADSLFPFCSRESFVKHFNDSDVQSGEDLFCDAWPTERMLRHLEKYVTNDSNSIKTIEIRQEAQLNRIGLLLERLVKMTQEDTKMSKPLLTADEAAELCGVKRSTWYRMRSAGKCPSPLNINRRVVWRRNELIAWLEAGAPSMDKWDTIKAKKN